MKSELNILVVSHLFPPETGGVQQVASNIAAKSSHNVTVLASSAESETSDDQSSYEIHRADLTGIRGLLTQAFLVLWLGFKTNSDMIYYTRPEYAFFATPFRLLGRPIVSHAHGSELYANGNRLHSLYLKLSLWTIDHFIAISEFTQSRLQDLRVSNSAITIIPNGVDFDRFNENPDESLDLPVDSDTPVILTVGRIVERKGHEHIIRALPDLKSNAEYLVVGPGDSDPLATVAQKEGVEDRTHFLGKVSEDELIALYQRADVFAMPAESVEGDVEGFGLVYLEANAAETPTIGSAIGGVPSAINDETTGLLTEPAPQAVAAALDRVLTNPEFRTSLEENAREWAREHDWETIVGEWDSLLNELIIEECKR